MLSQPAGYRPATFRQAPSDPHGLDGNDQDGIVCESLAHRPAGTRQVVAADPTVEQFDCATDGLAAEVVIPRVEGIRYLVHDQNGGQPISETTIAAAPGPYHLTALPEEGFELPDGQSEVTWTLTVESIDECAGARGEPDRCDLVDQLDVAEEDRTGYDRDLFGDYDRDALLAASLDEHGDYYSTWDDTHYDHPGDVDVDHTVALAEAWDSGAHSWDAATLDAFGGDPINLTLLTDEVNQADKSDGDFAEWVPVGSCPAPATPPR